MSRATNPTSCEAHQAHRASGKSAAQRARILNFIRARGGDWSIGEIAQALDMEKSTVSPRLNELLNQTKELVERPKRKDRVSGITVRPVGFPQTGEQMLLPHFYSTGQCPSANSGPSGNSGTEYRSFSRGGL